MQTVTQTHEINVKWKGLIVAGAEEKGGSWEDDKDRVGTGREERQ